jgi:hypothetical protein
MHQDCCMTGCYCRKDLWLMEPDMETTEPQRLARTRGLVNAIFAVEVSKAIFKSILSQYHDQDGIMDGKAL